MFLFKFKKFIFNWCLCRKNRTSSIKKAQAVFFYDKNFNFFFCVKHDVILPEQAIGLSTSYQLLPEIFQQFGYNTHAVGKYEKNLSF